MVEAEGPREVEEAEVVVAALEGFVALAGGLPTVGHGVVQRHVLSVVDLKRVVHLLGLAEEGADVGLVAVAVVEVEDEGGDVVFALGVAVEHVVALASEDAALLEVEEEAVGVGDAAVAL